VLVIKDIVLFVWGPEDLVGRERRPRHGSQIWTPHPRLYLLLIVSAVGVAAMWLLLTVRVGRVGAGSHPGPEMVGALGVDRPSFSPRCSSSAPFWQAWAGRCKSRASRPISSSTSRQSRCLRGHVVGGLGSIGGASWPPCCRRRKPSCIGVGTAHWFGRNRLSKLTLVVEFLIWRWFLVARPFGLFGQAAGQQRIAADPAPPLAAPSWTFAVVWLALLLAVPMVADRYVTILLTDIFCFALFAVSLHFIMGPAGMVSVRPCRLFRLGAYAGRLLLKRAGLPMEAALVLAPLAAAPSPWSMAGSACGLPASILPC